MRSRAVRTGALLVAVLAAAFIGPPVQAESEKTPASARPTAAGTPPPDDCLIVNASGEQAWFGGDDPQVSKLGDALQNLADDHPDQIAGVSYCSHYDGAMIFVASPDDSVLKAISVVAAQHTDFKVVTRHVAAPLKELLAAQRQLILNSPAKGLVIGVGPDIYTGGLTIDVAPANWPLTDHDRQLIVDSVNAGRRSPLPLTLRKGDYIEKLDSSPAD